MCHKPLAPPRTESNPSAPAPSTPIPSQTSLAVEQARSGLLRDRHLLVVDMMEHRFPRKCVKTNSETTRVSNDRYTFIPNSGRISSLLNQFIVIPAFGFGFFGSLWIWITTGSYFYGLFAAALVSGFFVGLPRLIEGSYGYRFDVAIPCSDQAWRRRLRIRALGRILAILGVALTTLAIALTFVSSIFFVAVLFGVLFTVVVPVSIDIQSEGLLNVAKATRRSIWLKGCSPQFLEQLPQISANEFQNAKH